MEFKDLARLRLLDRKEKEGVKGGQKYIKIDTHAIAAFLKAFDDSLTPGLARAALAEERDRGSYSSSASTNLEEIRVKIGRVELA